MPPRPAMPSLSPDGATARDGGLAEVPPVAEVLGARAYLGAPRLDPHSRTLHALRVHGRDPPCGTAHRCFAAGQWVGASTPGPRVTADPTSVEKGYPRCPAMADGTGRPGYPPSVKDELWGAPDEAPLEDTVVPPDDVWGAALGSNRSDIRATSWRWAGRGGSLTQPTEQGPEPNPPRVPDTVDPAPSEFDILRSQLETVRSSLTSAVTALESQLSLGMGALTARIERLETDGTFQQALAHDRGTDDTPGGRPLSMRLTSLGKRARTDVARLSEVLVARRSGDGPAAAPDSALSADVLAPLRSDLCRLEEEVKQIGDVLADLHQRLPAARPTAKSPAPARRTSKAAAEPAGRRASPGEKGSAAARPVAVVRGAKPPTARKAAGAAKRAAPKETGVNKASSARAAPKPATGTVSAPRARRPPGGREPGS